MRLLNRISFVTRGLVVLLLGTGLLSSATVMAQTADLSITKSDSSDPAVVGQNLTYDVRVTNNGPSDATDVTLTDTLPGSVTFVSADPEQGSCSEATGTVTCDLGSLANGVEVQVTIEVTPTSVEMITNSAQVTATEPDPDSANNSVMETTEVIASADLSVTKNDSPDPVTDGQNLTYDLQVTNDGPSDATDVTLTDTLPGSVTFVSADAEQGSCSEATGTVTCDLGSLANGETAQVTIVVTATSPGMSTNSAEVTATESDPDSANNSVMETTEVTASADLSIIKSDSPDPVTVDQNLTYDVRITNNGPSDATGVTLTDTLPEEVTFVSADPEQGSCTQSAGTVTCDLGAVDEGATVQVTIVVSPTSLGIIITNSAQVAGTESDPDSANDSVTETTRIIGDLSNRLLFPFYRGDVSNFSGFALTNFSTNTLARVQVEGITTDGDLHEFPNNPNLSDLSFQAQSARLGSDIFGIDLDEPQSGWVRITSDIPELGSFFQFGNGLSEPLTQLDGSVAFTEPSQVLFFTRLFDGPATFPNVQTGFQDAETFLSIANPDDDQAITLTLQFFTNSGFLDSQSTRQLPRGGSLFETVRSLFNKVESTPIGSGYVRVDASGSGAIGFELIQLEDSIFGLNASVGNEQNTLFSAQLANGTDLLVSSIFTNLKAINTSTDTRVFTMTAFRDNGQEIGTAGVFSLLPNSSFQIEVGTLFGIGPSVGSELITGSIRIDVDGPGLIGDVVFGDPGDPFTGTPNVIDFVAALPLQTEGFTRAIFSQVANGSPDPSKPSLSVFTGLALFNPNSGNAEVTIRVFDNDGNLVGDTTLTLGVNERRSELVETLVSESAGLLGGYIEVVSDQPLIAQQFFGNSTLQFLSAVPPSIVE